MYLLGILMHNIYCLKPFLYSPYAAQSPKKPNLKFLNVCPFDYTAVAVVGRWAR